MRFTRQRASVWNSKWFKRCVIAAIIIIPLWYVLYILTGNSHYRHLELIIPFFGLDNLPIIRHIWPKLNGTAQLHNKTVIPNIAHYVWLNCHEFKYLNLLSMISVHRYMKPDYIYFHTNCEPTNAYWKEVKAGIPNLVLKHIDTPVEVFGQEIRPDWIEHKADVARLEVLLVYGGVYLDCDILIFKSLDHLRQYDYVATGENAMKVGNAIIFSTKDSPFLRIYFESYRNYISTCFDCNSLIKHSDLAYEHQELVHIEHYTFIACYIHSLKYFIFNSPWQDQFLGIHVWDGPRDFSETVRNYSPETTKQVDTSFGQMCRYIYYGTTDIITPDMPDKPWYDTTL